MNYKIGVADYGMDVWYGGNLNLEQRLELLKSCGIGGIEWLKAADMAEAVIPVPQASVSASTPRS